jgi:cell division protein FtsI (penicillin-binding protein 3)
MSDKALVAEAGRGWRLWLVLSLLLLIALAITARMLSLYVEEQAFLQTQGDARVLRTIQVPAHRGIITDRNGEPLAVSAPVATIWADPAMTDLQSPALGQLASLLKTNRKKLVAKLSENRAKRFIYLLRQASPDIAEQVRNLQISGIHIDRDYKRYYPAAEVATHLVGFTNLDGRGQEGLELAYEDWLQASSGKQLV